MARLFAKGLGCCRSFQGFPAVALAILAAACLSMHRFALAATDTAAPDIAGLAEELELMRQQLEGLEALRERVAELERQLEIARMQAQEQGAGGASADKRDVAAMSEKSQVVTQTEPVEESGIDFGGALRFNYYWNEYDEAVKAKRGDSGLDLFRINADGRLGNVLLSAEYRFYPFMNVLHHGWIGYEFDNDAHVEVGVTRVPFGLLPYASHNFWFGTPYYLGLEDDYDLGAKYVQSNGPWEWQAALFKNAELGSASDLDRYSFDVVAVGDTANEETNQANLRATYTLGADSTCSHEVGLSAQFGQIYNADTDRKGDHWAAGAHLDTRCSRWNLQLEAAHYRYRPENPPGVARDVIRIGGFGTSYDAAAEASVYIANLAYNLPVRWEAIDQLTCYNDFSIVVKDQPGFNDSKLNTTGCLIGVGPVYVYLDLIQAENMVFFSDGSLAGQGEEGWFRRFNVNVGYYW